MSLRAIFLSLSWLASAALLRAGGSPKTHVLMFFGDSLTAGYGLQDPDTQSYPARIEARIRREGLPWRVVNAGVSGDTSAGGLRRVGWALRTHPDVFVLALGANDGLRGIDPSETKRNLEAIIDRVRAARRDAAVVLAGMRLPPSLGPGYVRAFDAVFPAVAASRHVRLIPFLLQGVGGVPGLNQGDGIHPNARGAAIVADTVWKTLAPLLEAAKSAR